MHKTFLISIFILFLASCSKDKFNTTPSLKYKSVNKNVIGRNQGDIVFTLSFTDKEGDLGDLVIVKTEPVCANSNFVAPYPVPQFPTGKNQDGDILVTFTYDDISPKCAPRNDTAIFKFVLKDKAQNISDTTASEPIVIISN